jgi:RimJ/RimL family protein N-acetyltransferase
MTNIDNISIRPVQETDLNLFHSYWTGIMEENLDTLVPFWELPTLEQNKAAIQNHLEATGSIMFVAERDNEIVGVIHLSVVNRPTLNHAANIGVDSRFIPGNVLM